MATVVFIGSLAVLIGIAMWALLYGARGGDEEENYEDDNDYRGG